MLSELFIASQRGDIIVKHRYRKDTPEDAAKIFFRQLNKIKNQNLPPLLTHNGTSYYTIQRKGLYWVCVTKLSVSPFLVMEFLDRWHHLCADFCGSVSEASLRANQMLLQELMMEVVDHGHIQLMTTEKLKPHIYSEPKISRKTKILSETAVPGLFGLEKKSQPSVAASKSVLFNQTCILDPGATEIFADVIEKISVLVNPDGSTCRTDIVGKIQMKCFLHGSTEVKVGLNDDVCLHEGSKLKGYGLGINLENCQLHEAARKENEDGSLLRIHPPEGLFNLISYSLATDGNTPLPFTLQHKVNAVAERDLEVTLILRLNTPMHCEAVNVTVNLPVPSTTTRLMQQLQGLHDQKAVLQPTEKLVWFIRKFPGAAEARAVFRFVNGNLSSAPDLELGPASLDFEISAFTCSGLKIQSLKVLQAGTAPVRKWVRNVTLSDSYIFRFS